MSLNTVMFSEQRIKQLKPYSVNYILLAQLMLVKNRIHVRWM